MRNSLRFALIAACLAASVPDVHAKDPNTFKLIESRHPTLPLLIVDPVPGETPTADEQLAAAVRFYGDFIALLGRHPDPTMAQEMTQSFTKRELYLALVGFRTGGAAMFSATPSGEQVIPCLVIDLNESNTLTEMQMLLIVHHEYQHYRQFRLGKANWLTDNSWEPNERNLTSLFNGELEAYHEECKLAVSKGWEEAFPFCSTFKKRGYKGLVSVVGSMLAVQPSWQGQTATLARLVNAARASEGLVLLPE